MLALPSLRRGSRRNKGGIEMLKRGWLFASLILTFAGSMEWWHETRAHARDKSDQATAASGQSGNTRQIDLSTSKRLDLPVLGDPQRTNSFPTAAALSPNGRYLAVLNNGYGAHESRGSQSIAVLDLQTNQLADFPDSRLGSGGRDHRAHQTYFLGLGFSADGRELYASMASLTDYNGTQPGDTGNGIAVYRFEAGRV